MDGQRPPPPRRHDDQEAVARANQDLAPWIACVGGVLRRTFEAAVQRFLFRGALPPGLNDRQVRVAEWFASIHHEAPERRVKLNDVHAAFPHAPRRTLQLDLQRLSLAGVLDRQGERKGTTYAFAPSTT